MKFCQAKYTVLKQYYDDSPCAHNSINISEHTGLDLPTTYRCISSLLLSGHLKLSLICSSSQSIKRSADFYEITSEGIDFILQDRKFCKRWPSL